MRPDLERYLELRDRCAQAREPVTESRGMPIAPPPDRSAVAVADCPFIAFTTTSPVLVIVVTDTGAAAPGGGRTGGRGG